MCTIPPAPPLPPPSSFTTEEPKRTETVLKTLTNTELCQWASHVPELKEVCIKNNICIEKVPFKYKYRYTESIAQIGPTCGLVALSMLVNSEVTASEMLNISKLSGYTSNGEMFSCKNMVKLVEKVFSLAEIENVTCELKIGGLFSSETIQSLVDGAVIMVPYDADCNHSPCLRNGHTAHWALICGILIVNEPAETCKLDPDNIYVLCKHGKSKYLAMWKLADLDKSNKNLQEFSPKKGTDGLIYILPEGGIGGENGLSNQYLLFTGF